MRFQSVAAAMIMLVTGATSVQAAPLTLISGGLEVTNAVTCHVINASKKTVELITVALVPVTQPDNVVASVFCPQVEPGMGCPATMGVGGAGSYYCKVTISKGSKKDFRAMFCDVASGSCSEAR